MSDRKTVSIIIPTLNEVENISPLVTQLAATETPFQEIIFVDDGSNDGTQEAIRALQQTHPVRLIERDSTEVGLAAAIMAGAREARGDCLLVMDADLSHPPNHINDLLEPLLAHQADLVTGSRYVPGGSTPGWPFWRRTLSRLAAALAYPLTGVHDSMCGFFAISRQRLLDLSPRTGGFKIVFETILRGKRKLRVIEVPIAFQDRARGSSKMSPRVALHFLGQWLRAILQRGRRR